MAKNSSTSSSSSGVGFAGLLTILFIGLKLAHVIAWPWIWVLAPLWISGAIVVFILLIVFLVALVVL